MNTQPEQPKLVYVAQRQAGYTKERFTDRWRKHAALGMRQSRWCNIVRYLHCDRIPGLPDNTPSIDCDGIALVIYRNEAFRLAHVSDTEARKIMKADELQTFAQPVARTALLTREHVLKPGPAGEFKLFLFWKASSPEFADSWLAAGQQLKLQNEIVGMVQNCPVLPYADRSDGLDCDGIDELTANDIGTLQRAAAEWIQRSNLPATARMVMTRAVVLHDKSAPVVQNHG